MSYADPPTSVERMIESIATNFNFCRNRLWETARNLDGDDRFRFLEISNYTHPHLTGKHHGHEQCTFDFCEHSRLDYTTVGQRHESASCSNEPCGPKSFDSAILEAAVEAGGSTAWLLDGSGVIQRPQNFMAVSHVWSDGTGNGSWPPGQVNDCLFTYFKSIAEEYDCEGIWWDTICIPRNKAARSKAILNIQRSYEDARITLVHDSFLREWEWVNPEVACFAITISPWFSRGWTALELSRSRKVKVVFKGGVIKDLDEDILAFYRWDSVSSARHEIASHVIQTLRQQVRTVDGLLTVLGSRHMSWPRDLAIISAQLVGTYVWPGASQQDIYKEILKKMEVLPHTHLFHNSITMLDEFTWCPTNLFDLPRSPRPPGGYHFYLPERLFVQENGDLKGDWYIFNISDHLKDKYVWSGRHPLVLEKLLEALKNKDEHLLLVEPHDDLKPNDIVVTRALVVKIINDGRADKDESRPEVDVQYVGPVYFHSPLPFEDLSEGVIPSKGGVKVNILGRPLLRNDPYNSAPRTSAQRAMEAILKDGIKWNVPDENGDLPLHLAARMAHNPALSSLLNPERVQLSPSSDEYLKYVNQQTRDGKNALILAIRNGDFVSVNTLLRQGADSSQKDFSSWTSLHYASWRGDMITVKSLLSQEWNSTNYTKVGSLDRFGQSPLHLASERGNKEIVSALIKGGARLTEACHCKQLPLHRAAWAGARAIVQQLLSAYAHDHHTHGDIPFDARDHLGRTPLHIGCEKGNAPVVDLLLKQTPGPDLETRDMKGRNALHIAAAKGSSLIVELLLQHGAASDAVNQSKQTALHISAEKGHVGVVAQLLRKPELELKDENHFTPLFSAVINGHEAVVKMLLDAGAEINSRSKNGKTPLMSAAEYGHYYIVLDLLKAGADVDAIDDEGRSALQFSAANDHTGITSQLAEKSTDIELKTGGGRTHLLWACDNGYSELAELMLQRGANTEARDAENKFTPLIAAASNGHDTIIKRLIQAGAHVEAKDSEFGRSALAWAASKGHAWAARVLLEEGSADIETIDNDGKTPLALATLNSANETMLEMLLEKSAKLKPVNISMMFVNASRLGQVGVVRSLLARGVDTELKGKDGRTPLAAAAYTCRSNPAVVSLLLGRGADPYALDDSGLTPLQLAIKANSKKAIGVFLEHGVGLGSQEYGQILLWASRERHLDIVELVLQRGAEPAFRDPTTGQNALEIAESFEDTRLMDLLNKKSAKVVSNMKEKCQPVQASPAALDENGNAPRLTPTKSSEGPAKLVLSTKDANVNTKRISYRKPPHSHAVSQLCRDSIALLKTVGEKPATIESQIRQNENGSDSQWGGNGSGDEGKKEERRRLKKRLHGWKQAQKKKLERLTRRDQTQIEPSRSTS